MVVVEVVEVVVVVVVVVDDDDDDGDGDEEEDDVMGSFQITSGVFPSNGFCFRAPPPLPPFTEWTVL